MRPLITVLMVCFLLGGMYGYLGFADSVRRPDANHQRVAETKQVTVEINRSAALYADPGFDVAALKVDFKNQMVLEKMKELPANEPVVFDLADVEAGRNSIHVLASFEDPQQFLSQVKPPSLFAIEVVVRAGGKEIAKQVFSSPTSMLPVGGQVSFDTQVHQ